MAKIYLAGDHAGFEFKEKLKKYFDGAGITYEDLGPFEYNSRDDYPDFVIPLARKISKSRGAVGIVVAGSGVGECMCSNKFRGVRATLYHGGNVGIVRVSREHDNSNVLCLGSRFVSFLKVKDAVDVFLKTKFSKGRHLQRISKFRGLGS